MLVAPFAALRGEEWIILGPRAMGMGGAGVASIRGGYGMYWNPATLGMKTPTQSPEESTVRHPILDVEVPISVTLSVVGDVLPTASAVEALVRGLDFDTLDTKFQSGSLFSPSELRNTMDLLDQLQSLDDPGNGAVLGAGAGVGMRVWRVGFTLLGLAHAGARPRVDLSSLSALGNLGIDTVIGDEGSLGGRSISASSQAFADQLVSEGLVGPNQAQELLFHAEQAGVDTSDGGFQSALRSVLTTTQQNDGGSLADVLTNNESGLSLRGIILKELGMGYGHPIGEWLSIGAAVKLIEATTYFKPYSLETLEDGSEVLEDLLDTEREDDSVNVGFDVGVLVRPLDWLVFGAAGKYLNQPRFDVDGGDDYEIDPQLRVGAAVQPLSWLTLAADIDAFPNHSDSLPGYRSQVVGGGAEVNLFDNFFLRAGVSKNLEDASEDVIIHGGLGVRIWDFSLDFAAMVAPDLTDLDVDDGVQEVPERVGFSLMLGFDIPL